MVLDKAHHVPPIREGNRCLMDALMKTDHFKGDELPIIGICRKSKAVHMISCLVRRDGKEIRRDVLNKHEGLSRRQ